MKNKIQLLYIYWDAHTENNKLKLSVMKNETILNWEAYTEKQWIKITPNEKLIKQNCMLVFIWYKL